MEIMYRRQSMTEETLQIRALTENLMSRVTEFIQTNGYETAKYRLEYGGHVTIIGEEGSGKTSIALRLLRDGKDRLRPMVVTNLTELKLYRTWRQKTLVLIDDVFGKTVYSAADLQHWIEDFENLKGCLMSGRLQIIFTSRKQIFHDAMSNVAMRQLSLFKESIVVDLSNIGLSYKEKRAFLKMNSEQNGVKVSKKLRQFVENNSISGFPLSCGLLFQSSEWCDNPTKFLRKPKTCLQESISRMANSKLDAFSVLLLVLLKGGVLNLTELRETDPDLDMIKTWTKSSDMFAFIRKSKRLAPSLVGCFLQCSRQRHYSFAHQLIEDGVVYELGRTNPEFLLEHCPTRVLFEMVRITLSSEHGPTTQHCSQTFKVVLRDCHHHLMIDRFVSLLARREFATVCLHQALADDVFVEQLFTSMKKVSRYNSSHNICHVDKQYTGTLLHWSVLNPDSIFCDHILQENVYAYTEVRNALLVCCKSGNARALKSIFRSYPNIKQSIRSMFFRFNVLDHRINDRSVYNHTLLNTAIIFGHERIVDVVLSEVGHDSIQNALCLSCRVGHANLLQYLVNCGADINATCSTELTPLLEACTEGHLICVKECIRLGADIEATGSSDGSNTPIQEAGSMGHEHIVEFLLEQGACLDNTWDTAYRVFEGGCLKLATELWNRPNRVYNQMKIGPNGTLLHAASVSSQDKEENHLALVSMLVELNADVNATDNYGRTPLLNAAASGGKSIVTYLIDNGASVNVVDRNGQTLFHEAAKGNLLGDVKQIMDMLKMTTMQTAVNEEDQTPLCRAAAYGQVASAQILLGHGAEANTVSSQGRTPLHWAAESGSADVVLLLLAQGADITSKDAKGNTALLSASELGYIDIVDVLLANNADVNASDATGRTPIMAASTGGHSDTVTLLVLYGADVYATDQSKETALHKACGGYSDTVHVLLKNMAEVNAMDRLGRTPLHVAMYSGYAESANILLEHRADINVNVDATDVWKRTPLHLAVQYSNHQALVTLLQHGVNVDAADDQEKTPLHLAVQYSNHQALVTLLQHGVNVDAADTFGKTPLHLAAELGRPNIMETLLSCRADVDALDKQGNTPLHLAIKTTFEKSVQVLLNYNANVDITNEANQTPLHIAAASLRNQSILSLLIGHGADLEGMDHDGRTPVDVASDSIVQELTGL